MILRISEGKTRDPRIDHPASLLYATIINMWSKTIWIKYFLKYKNSYALCQHYDALIFVV